MTKLALDMATFLMAERDGLFGFQAADRKGNEVIIAMTAAQVEALIIALLQTAYTAGPAQTSEPLGERPGPVQGIRFHEFRIGLDAMETPLLQMRAGATRLLTLLDEPVLTQLLAELSRMATAAAMRHGTPQ